jgi:molybdopterin synthase catalytic subunit
MALALVDSETWTDAMQTVHLKPMSNKQIIKNDDTWLELTESILNVGDVYDWSVLPSCGAVVVFSGVVRDHAEGRTDVTSLTYEAYNTQVVSKLQLIVDEMRARWIDLGRVALIHRVGNLVLGESSVLVSVSSPHRPEAFSAAQFAIDTLKESVPIWKQEHWKQGSDWGTNSNEISRPRTGLSVDSSVQ